jgi:hypothetical protein
MRAKLWLLLLGLFLAIGLVSRQSSQGQTPLVPIGRPYMMAQGFTPLQNQVIDTSYPVTPVMPPNQMGIRLPNFLSFLRIPNHGTQIGVSPMPQPSSFPSMQYPNALNPFSSPLKTN